MSLYFWRGIVPHELEAGSGLVLSIDSYLGSLSRKDTIRLRIAREPLIDRMRVSVETLQDA